MKRAFTMAEMLITLTIIGVIAILMISNLLKAKPDQNALVYKKTFYSIQDAIRYLVNDTNKYPDADEGFITTDTGVLNSKSYQQYFCEQVADALNTIGSINCGNSAKGDDDGRITDTSSVEFQLQNGAALSGFNQTYADEDSSDDTKDSITICVDVNGLAKGPNKGCSYDDRNVKNRDQYKFRVHSDGKVSTGSEDETGIDWAAENAILEETGINKKK